MIISCPFCAVPLNVGDEVRSVVAICNPPSGTIRTCDTKTWGSPKTRVQCASDADWRNDKTGEVVVAHTLQTNPPETVEERNAREAPPAPVGIDVDREASVI